MKSKISIPAWMLWAFAIVSFIGFFDASYLTVHHYTGDPLQCGLTGGCDTVTNSKYSTIFGIPVALGGALYYLTVFILTMFYVDTKKPIVLRLLPPLTIAGLGASAWFLYVQAFLLKAYCQYCLLSALTSTILFVLGMILWRKKK